MHQNLLNKIDLFLQEHQRFLRKLTIFILTILVTTYFTSLDIGTGSLSHKYFISTSLVKAGKGNYAVIDGHGTKYFHGLKYIKKIVGVENDVINIKNNQIYINNQFIGFILTKTKDNKPLTAIKKQIIPQGYVFVAGEHERSFDSRYEEFGLVKLEYIKRRSFALW